MDESVVRRAQDGDQEAFRAIVDESLDRLYAVSSLMTRDHSLAEDAVQDALLRAWRDLPSLRDPARLSAWLTRLTVNATYDVLRKRRRIREISPLADDFPGSANPIAESIDRSVLLWAFDRLSLDQRAVVVLHYYLGHSLDEAAETLRIPPGTVRSRLSAALRNLRVAMDTSNIGTPPALREMAQ